MILRYIYTSVATHPHEVNPDLPRILRTSRRHNAEMGVTGFLVYGSGFFAQCLEGPGDAVAALADRIEQDPAHLGVEVLETSARKHRAFAGWDMGFYRPAQRGDLKGLDDTLRHADVGTVMHILQEGARAARSISAQNIVYLSAPDLEASRRAI